MLVLLAAEHGAAQQAQRSWDTEWVLQVGLRWKWGAGGGEAGLPAVRAAGGLHVPFPRALQLHSCLLPACKMLAGGGPHPLPHSSHPLAPPPTWCRTHLQAKQELLHLVHMGLRQLQARSRLSVLLLKQLGWFLQQGLAATTGIKILHVPDEEEEKGGWVGRPHW